MSFSSGNKPIKELCDQKRGDNENQRAKRAQLVVFFGFPAHETATFSLCKPLDRPTGTGYTSGIMPSNEPTDKPMKSARKRLADVVIFIGMAVNVVVILLILWFFVL